MTEKRSEKTNRQQLAKDVLEFFDRECSPIKKLDPKVKKYYPEYQRAKSLAENIYALYACDLSSHDFRNQLEELLNKDSMDMYSVISLIEHVRSESARNNVKHRHEETYDLKKQALDYWHENIDPSVPNTTAGELLSKIVPVKPRKLSEYVSKAKKANLPPTSTEDS